MKLLVQTLKAKSIDGITSFEIDENLTEEILSKNINEAKTRAIQLKTERSPHKIRVIEYHNDEPDETRVACKVLF